MRTLAVGLLTLCAFASVAVAEDAGVVFVVDPSWDCVASYAANVPRLHDYKIIKVFNRLGQSYPCADSPNVDIYRNFTYNSFHANDADAADELCPMLKDLGFPIAAVVPTFDPATYLADRLAACVGAKGNPFEGPKAHARFDKWAMSEAVRSAGLRAVKEKLVTTWPEAQEYLESLDPPLSQRNPVVLKVLQSSDSQGVFKVYSVEQAEATFKAQVGGKTFLGETIAQVIIQECFLGKEYVVDSVSRDGVHKTIVVWNEDLRPGNGYFDLYYGFKLQNPEDDRIKKIIEYSKGVLDAVGVQNGASDMEIFWVDGEETPCVTDMNARWTALMWQDGLNVEQMITGRDQITSTFDALLDADAFKAIPPVYTMSEYAAILFVLPHHTGVITGIPGLPMTKKLPSFWKSYNEGLYPGKVIPQLYNTQPAIYIMLRHADVAVIKQDYDFIIDLETYNYFFDIIPASAVTLGSALSPVSGLAALATLATAAAAVVWAVRSRSKRRDASDSEYLLLA